MSAFPQFLIDGYHHFAANRYETEQTRYRKLAEAGQKPSTLLIGCCDSRAAPETIFDVGPGELFVIRNVANLVPPYEPDAQYHSTSSALEFGVRALEVQHIVVMGHGRCGGIGAALDSNPQPLSPGDFIGNWMRLLKPSAESIAGNELMTPAERQTALERISIRFSLRNLLTFPFIEEAVSAGRLTLHGAWFDIALGELWIMNDETGDFIRPVPDVTPE
ncbi:carbonic anhydrase [Faunimonas pinastri]|uniref:carbonic anhydrase n=1 Tax=Faunimonas pinastri TaxID=1855383 RepID=A0A1H9MBK8_9HYPH|nr:carbonic anhydrase [Faunimonas pinastri]SER21150.1 carbonic anhydrase [Faunimonas pinastri]